MKRKLIIFTISVIFIMTMLNFSAFAAPAKPQLLNDPIDGQILPYYDVWLRWIDNTDEAYYTMTIRDLTTGNLISTRAVPQNSTYYIVYKSELVRGHKYRWCLNAYDSNGNRKASASPTFTIEPHSPDTHVRSGGYSSASRLEYFVYATTTGYDSILNQAAQAWNGISSNVNLVRTSSPSDGKYEIGIYESPTPSNSTSFGYACCKTGGMNGTEVLNHSLPHDYAEIRTFRQNIINAYNSYSSQFIIADVNTLMKSNAIHETGHALGLSHTSCKAQDANLYTICHSTDTNAVIPLIMNSGQEIGPR